MAKKLTKQVNTMTVTYISRYILAVAYALQFH